SAGPPLAAQIAQRTPRFRFEHAVKVGSGRLYGAKHLAELRGAERDDDPGPGAAGRGDRVDVENRVRPLLPELAALLRRTEVRQRRRPGALWVRSVPLLGAPGRPVLPRPDVVAAFQHLFLRRDKRRLDAARVRHAIVPA